MDVLTKIYNDERVEYDYSKLADMKVFVYPLNKSFVFNDLLSFVKHKNDDIYEFQAKCKQFNNNFSEKERNKLLDYIKNYKKANIYSDNEFYVGKRDYFSKLVSVKESKKIKLDRNIPHYIIVPQSVDSPIKIQNVEQLIKNNKFVEIDFEMMISFTGKCSFEWKDVKFDIVEDPSLFNSRSWNRVVAIFLDGTEWQFKNWLYKDMTELGKKIPIFYVRYEKKKVNDVFGLNIYDVYIDKDLGQVKFGLNIGDIIYKKIVTTNKEH